MENIDYSNMDIYTDDQKREISLGLQMGLDVSVYARPEFLAIQMQEIRMGMLEHLPIEWYAKPEYDWFQMEEIRKGLQQGMNIQAYADPTIPFEVMRQIRKGLEDGLDLSSCKNLPAGILRELRKAKKDHIDIDAYINQGYDEEQLKEIRLAIKAGVNVEPYLVSSYRGVSIREIRLGLEHNVDVSVYAKIDYNWHQMKEIRLGLEKRLDVSAYQNDLYSWQQMREIRLGLEEGLDVTRYSSMMYTAQAMEEKRQEMLEESTVPFTSGSMQEEEYSKFTLLVNDNGMEAVVLLHEKQVPIPEEALFAALKENKVVRGIDYKTVKQICDGAVTSDIVVIAKGQTPKVGEDGRYEFFFDVDIKAKPVRLEDGSVDYQNAKWFELVEKDQTIVKYHPATFGENGYNIWGEVLPAKKGKEQTVLSGKGFAILDDKCTYVATMNGKVDYKDGRIEINNVLALKDVNLATGNIFFDGSIYIQGSVGDGITIEATKDILVDGFIGASTLKAGGDVILRQGNNAAGKGKVMADGSVSGSFFEGANVEAGENIFANYCMNSHLDANDRIEISGRNGVLVGGVTCAGACVQAFNIGNAAGVATKLIVGNKKEILIKEAKVLEKQKTVTKELKLFRNAYVDFQRKFKPEVRNMNPVYIKIEDAIYTKEMELEKLETQKQEIEEMKEKADSATIVALGALYDGVTVELNGATWNSKRVDRVTLKKKGNHINLFRNNSWN